MSAILHWDTGWTGGRCWLGGSSDAECWLAACVARSVIKCKDCQRAEDPPAHQVPIMEAGPDLGINPTRRGAAPLAYLTSASLGEEEERRALPRQVVSPPHPQRRCP